MFRWVGSLIIALFALARLTQYGLAQTAVDTASYADGVKFLDQNWSHDERLEYYYTSQGSAALRYGIFVAVEQVDTQTGPTQTSPASASSPSRPTRNTIPMASRSASRKLRCRMDDGRANGLA
jgi:hypothetical protein